MIQAQQILHKIRDEEKRKQRELDALHERMIAEVEARLDPPVSSQYSVSSVSGYISYITGAPYIQTHSMGYSLVVTNMSYSTISATHMSYSTKSLPQSIFVPKHRTLSDILQEAESASSPNNQPPST